MSVLDDYLATIRSVTLDDTVGIGGPQRVPLDGLGVEPGDLINQFMDVAPVLTVPGSLHDYARQLDLGDVSSEELVLDILRRGQEGDLREVGWEYLSQTAIDEARASDQRRACGEGLGVLDGIPIGVKDLVHVAGQHTGCGSRHGYPGIAETDATCVSRLRDSGALVVGKTTTHEFAFGGTTPPTRNPWDRNRIPGGSSGGSGAVVGAGWVPVAIGTDTAGSVRIPASYCGAVGFIGSRHAVPTDGVATLAWSLDTVGPLTRCVRDAASVAAVMAGREHFPSPESKIPSVIGIPRRVLGPLDPGVECAFFASVQALQDRGVIEIDVPWPDEDVLQAVGFIVMMAESAEFHRQRMRASELFDPEISELLRLGGEITATDYIRARRVQELVSEEINEVFDRVPVVITPTLPCLPAPYGSGTFTPVSLGANTMTLASAHTRYPLIANVAGLPSGTVPCGKAGGVPVGLQVLGAPGSDDLVLAVMAGIESVLAEAGLWHVGEIAPFDLADQTDTSKEGQFDRG